MEDQTLGSIQQFFPTISRVTISNGLKIKFRARNLRNREIFLRTLGSTSDEISSSVQFLINLQLLWGLMVYKSSGLYNDWI